MAHGGHWTVLFRHSENGELVQCKCPCWTFPTTYWRINGWRVVGAMMHGDATESKHENRQRLWMDSTDGGGVGWSKAEPPARGELLLALAQARRAPEHWA